MKQRRVVIVIEMETDAPLAILSSEKSWQRCMDECWNQSMPHRTGRKPPIIAQVQANVIRPKKAKK